VEGRQGLASFGGPLKEWEVGGPLSGAINESHPDMRLKWGCDSGPQIEHLSWVGKTILEYS